jgi:hypothetical protein
MYTNNIDLTPAAVTHGYWKGISCTPPSLLPDTPVLALL